MSDEHEKLGGEGFGKLGGEGFGKLGGEGFGEEDDDVEAHKLGDDPGKLGDDPGRSRLSA